MNREEFGKLVASLRKEIIDLRTNKFVTAKELARRSNLLEKTVSEIERGRKMNLDPETMTSLATGLGLTSLERHALQNAASEIDIDPLPDIAPPEEILQRLLNATQSICVPAMIYDSYFNIIAGNSIMFALSGISDMGQIREGEDEPAKYNLLRYIFDESLTYRNVTGPMGKTYAQRNIHHFRAISIKYRYTERFGAIFNDLCNYLAFQEAWSASRYNDRDVYNQWGELEYIHSKYGALDVISTEAVTLTSQENLYLVTHIPRSRETMRTFEELGKEVGLNMHRFAPWPYPS